MKKVYLFLLLCSATSSVFSQTQIRLNFQAKDAQTQNVLTLDSISVKNVTENCDTAFITETANEPISWVIQNVSWPESIDKINASNSEEICLKQNFPNPFRGATKISIYKKNSGSMILLLTDGSGRKLSVWQNKLDKGFHSFEISASAIGVFVLSASDNRTSKSIRIINSNQGLASNSIQYLGQSPDFKNGILKSSENTGFIFYLGNEMAYTAHVNGFSDQTITDYPTTDSTYTFSMTEVSSPSVETYMVTDIMQNTATGHGYVTSDGGETITARGVCWNTTGSPTTSDNITEDGTVTGSFSSLLTGLTANTPYYVRAYATNSLGTSYGEEVTFTTSLPLLGTEAAIQDTLLYCYSKLYDYNELLYLFDAVYSNNVPAPDASWADIYNHSQTPDNEKVLMLWANAFDIIYNTNLVIQSSEIVITDQQTHDHIIAQAKAIKAYLYYNLVNWFGEVPIEPGTAESVIPRNTIIDVLAQINQDATDASQLLPMSWTVPDNFRTTKSFAKALLSRTNLYSNNYLEALNPTLDIINSGMYALSVDPSNFITSSPEIICGFEKRNNTEFNTFFDKGSFVPIIRLTESYLISAESLLNTGNQASALNYINMLISRRGLPMVISLTSDELFQQWNIELAKEGNMFITLKRFGKALSLVQSPHKLVLPVPMSFIISNVNLTQNPGY